MDGPSSATGRQKRVLPSRSRRGGPGLGSCDTDNLILETHKRQSENEPLIPPDTKFLLTTDPTYDIEPSEAPELGLRYNRVANERYFDRPEVLASFREQTTIQTPSFHSIGEQASGRFRPRNNPDELSFELSDVAYEKRHRRYETFEKRQRLREKEKLQHEHYKLKERIDQLRAMDGSAFMNLPEASFTPPPARLTDDDQEEEMAMNGGIYHAEGERRRKIMMDIAIKLERRYAYLLPRKGQEVASAAATSSKVLDSRDEESDGERASTTVQSRKDGTVKLRLPIPKSSASSSPAPSPTPSKTIAPKKSRQAPSISVSRTPSSKSRRRSTSPPPPPPPEPLPPQQTIVRPTSPVVDIERESPEPDHTLLSHPSPVPSSPKPSSKDGETTTEPSARPSPMVEDAPLPDQAPDINGTRIIQKAHEASPSLPSQPLRELGMRPPEDDVASEKGPSDDDTNREGAEDVVEAISKPKKSKAKMMKQSAKKMKQEPGRADGQSSREAPSLSNPIPTKKRKYTKKKSTVAAVVEDKLEEPHPVYQPPPNSADPETSEKPPASPRPVPTLEPPPDPQAVEEPIDEAPPVIEDSISVRPAKRRRKESILESVSAAVAGPSAPGRTPSLQPSDRYASERPGVASTIPARRKEPSVEYFSEETGETRSYSMLIIAAVRQRGVSRAVGKGRYAFGSTTPEFHKQYDVDFDLPMYFRYAKDPSESGDEGEVDQMLDEGGQVEQQGQVADEAEAAETEVAGTNDQEKDEETPVEVEEDSQATEIDIERGSPEPQMSEELAEHPVEDVVYVRRRTRSSSRRRDEAMDTSDAGNRLQVLDIVHSPPPS